MSNIKLYELKTENSEEINAIIDRFKDKLVLIDGLCVGKVADVWKDGNFIEAQIMFRVTNQFVAESRYLCSKCGSREFIQNTSHGHAFGDEWINELHYECKKCGDLTYMGCI